MARERQAVVVLVGHHGGAGYGMSDAVDRAGFVAAVDQLPLNGANDIGINGGVGG